MNHKQAFSQVDDIACEGFLKFIKNGFWDDVNWSVYECTDCDARVCAVGGLPHHWNFVSDKTTHMCNHQLKFTETYLNHDIYRCVICGQRVFCKQVDMSDINNWYDGYTNIEFDTEYEMNILHILSKLIKRGEVIHDNRIKQEAAEAAEIKKTLKVKRKFDKKFLKLGMRQCLEMNKREFKQMVRNAEVHYELGYIRYVFYIGTDKDDFKVQLSCNHKGVLAVHKGIRMTIAKRDNLAEFLWLAINYKDESCDDKEIPF